MTRPRQRRNFINLSSTFPVMKETTILAYEEVPLPPYQQGGLSAHTLRLPAPRL